MANFSYNLNEYVRVELKGKSVLTGTLVFVGVDIAVLYSLKQYVYICKIHIHSIEVQQVDSLVIEVYNSNDRKTLADTILDSLNQAEFKVDAAKLKKDIELLKDETVPFTIQEAFKNAKGHWVSLFLSPTIQIAGKINELKDDYFTFYSPALQKEIYIATAHLHFFNVLENAPFELEEEVLAANLTSNQLLPNTFSNLISTFSNSFIIVNNNNPIYVKHTNDSFIQATTTTGSSIYYGIEHIKTIQAT